MNRLFILREPLHVESMIAFVRANWKAFADDGKPLSGLFSPYKRKRSSEQNALMWVWLTQISREAWIGGRQFDEETWNEHHKRLFLPERTNRGKDKWKYLPDGSRLLAISTPDLDTAEMSLYMTALEAYAATDLGVTIR